LRESSVLGVALLAREGRLAPDTVESMYAGGVRLRGQALAETLIRHSGRPEVGPWTLVRSVRTAVHPALRGRGLGRQLVEHVHRSLGPDVDAIGTLFGATAELVRFRHAGGYLPVRLGSSRGGRTGEPSVVMLRPLSVQARETTSELRAIFARDLPGGVALAAAEGVPLEADLLAQLRRDLPEPRPLEEGEIRRLVRAYAYRGGTHEVSALALRELVDADPAVLDALTPVERRLIVSRVLRGQAWDDVADSAGLADARVAMRALRRAVRAFLETKERISAGDQSAT
ncbi:MAG: tRNA(Met) cytidine acetyltransferase, partial [Deltaproteobacteria bacterium]|nr:tRNA(Met) cytidine acetyltransferase [Deltaproteobacteria bacterium]